VIYKSFDLNRPQQCIVNDINVRMQLKMRQSESRIKWPSLIRKFLIAYIIIIIFASSLFYTCNCEIWNIRSSYIQPSVSVTRFTVDYVIVTWRDFPMRMHACMTNIYIYNSLMLYFKKLHVQDAINCQLQTLLQSVNRYQRYSKSKGACSFLKHSMYFVHVYQNPCTSHAWETMAENK